MKTIAIFGGSGGLGSPLCELFVKNNNFNVIKLSSKDVDVSSKKSTDIFFNTNDVDIVINLTAYNHDSFIHKYTEEKIIELEKQIDVNVKGFTNILSSCLPKMRSKKYGRIISTSSIVADNPVMGTSIYGASKKFMESMIATCALENGSNGITSNAIQLGYFDGGLLYKLNEENRDKIKQTIPLKRWGKIEELYDTCMFLINTEYVNGSVIKINGGI